MGAGDKRWAKEADELQFGQLATIRSTAGNWRTGLIALTALIAVVTVVQGPDAAADLSSTGRKVAAALAGLGLAALLAGSGCAMRASFGLPAPAEVLTSESLKQYIASESESVKTWLYGSIVLFFAGVILVAGAIGITWFDADLWGDDEPLVVVKSEKFPRGPICGKLKSSGPKKLVIEEDIPNDTRTVYVFYQGLTDFQFASECDEPG